MLFNSYAFLCFLPVVLAVYWLTRHNLRWQNTVVLAASYVFYGWWDVRFLALIAGITAAGWTAGLAMGRYGRESRAGRAACALCVAGCLGVLGAFKYYDFFVTSFREAFAALGWHFCLPLWRVVLPVGISFYTFQVLSYAIDVRRGKIPVCRDAVAFAAFVSFFPQLVAGPIERASDLLPQMLRQRNVSYAEVTDGLRQMLWGFAKKMLVADRCAPIVDAIYANPASGGTDLWAATVLFAFQIYCDFSGYSDIAIGTARLFGIRLTRNFNVPYFSRDVAEFWRRWHTSLMSWFRDYVYIPLGGSRRGSLRAWGNTAAVFLLSGLWHGANWTFVVWGLYHALLFLPRRICGKRRNADKASCVASGRLLPSWLEAGQMGLTFFLVCVGWVWFRSEEVSSAAGRLVTMFTDFSFATPYGGRAVWITPLLMLGTEWLTRSRRHGLDWQGHGLLRRRAVRWAIYYALIVATLYYGGPQTAFIYFQF